MSIDRPRHRLTEKQTDRKLDRQKDKQTDKHFGVPYNKARNTDLIDSER